MSREPADTPRPQVLKHFVRDWSAEGKGERDALFPPILDALQEEYPTRDSAQPIDVLVPGCGLARLAFEIASLGFAVEANDCEVPRCLFALRASHSILPPLAVSHFMNLASSLIFRRTQKVDQHVVHPYIHTFSHHRSIANMTRPISFPDVVPPAGLDLHFEPGDFLSLFPEKETHEAVVTLFFIDTVKSTVSRCRCRR